MFVYSIEYAIIKAIKVAIKALTIDTVNEFFSVVVKSAEDVACLT